MTTTFGRLAFNLVIVLFQGDVNIKFGFSSRCITVILGPRGTTHKNSRHFDIGQNSFIYIMLLTGIKSWPNIQNLYE